MNAKLIVYSPSGNPTSVGIKEEIPINITIAIADVREPDKRNSSFSKTIVIPGSQTVNRLFEHIFDVTTELTNFNPNLKTRCEYFVKSERVFEGDLQLLRIKPRGKSPYIEVEYECSVVGRLANVFLDLGNAMLTDLDFSDLNHTFDYPNRNWTPTLGTGYTYPFIDYGVTGGNTGSWTFEHLKPAIFEVEYVNRILTSIGKTKTSTYFSSTYARSIIIPDVNEGPLKMTATQVNAMSFYAGKSALTTFSNLTGAYTGGSFGAWVFGGFNYDGIVGNLVFNDDSTLPFYDGGNNYSTVSSTYTTPFEGSFNLVTFNKFEILVNPPAGTVSMGIVNTYYTFKVDIVTSGGTLITTQSVQTTANFSTYTEFTVQAQIPSVYLGFGTQLSCRITKDDQSNLSTKFFDAGMSPITSGTASLTIRQKVGSWYSGTTANGYLPLTYTVDMNSTVPKNVRQIDFLMSVIKAENLYMELDLTDSNNYIIEKRDDFFLNSAPLDWTDKWDYQRGDEIIPMGDLDWREYLFTYKSDGDKYNKLYKDAYGEVYGQEQIYVNNDFIKSTKKNELIFAATPLVGNTVNNIVAPVLAQIDGVNIKPMTCQIRRLYWGGLLNSTGWNLVYANTNYNNQIQYPYCGHLDNPYSPTIDLCWDNPKELYYFLPAQTYTNNNLYVRNYKKMIDQITDQNSKIVIKWMYLTPKDIANFTFRKKIWIHDSLYLVNKIMDYDPQEVSLCRVEFLRLAFVDNPVTEVIELWNNGEGSSSGSQYGIKVNYGNNPNDISGDSPAGSNNYVYGGNSSIIGGYNNYVGGITNADTDTP